jgi:CheY-like chemotaxis protein/nitrogen-specific signal transduction histidine kinase
MSKQCDVVERLATLPVQSVQAGKVDALVQLGGAVAHELNNALVSILGNLQIITEKLGALNDAPPQIWNSLAAANRGVARVATLANELQAATGTRGFERQLLSASVLMREFAGELNKWTDSSIATNVELAQDLWSIETDAHQFAVAMQHLVTNAVEAMPHGGMLEIKAQNTVIDPSQASTGAVDSGEYVLVTVTDSGEGMTREVQQRALELFFTTRSGMGKLGLGLSQVHNLMKWSQGMVRLANPQEAGCRVELYFPRARAAKAADVPTRGRDLEGVILLVEDDNDVREYLLDTLVGLGYDAVGVPDAGKALHYLELGESRFILLLTDVNLPGMDGLELARRARESFPELRTLIMSGNFEALQRKAEQAGKYTGFIAKPMRKTELSNHIVALLSN